MPNKLNTVHHQEIGNQKRSMEMQNKTAWATPTIICVASERPEGTARAASRGWLNPTMTWTVLTARSVAAPAIPRRFCTG